MKRKQTIQRIYNYTKLLIMAFHKGLLTPSKIQSESDKDEATREQIKE